MIINSANLEALRVAFNASFNRGLGQTESLYSRIATTVPSSTKENRYGWLGKSPSMREWIGPRVVNGLAEHDYSIKNKSFEMTIGVDRDDIEDDNIGVYDPMFVELGEATSAHPDQLVWNLLAAGFATECYDGQYFFDTDHPVLDADGNPSTASNFGGGAGTAWYMLNTKRALKPIIYQERKAAEFVAKDKVTDDNVFSRKEYVYGVDSRCNVGYAFWQMAYASKDTLNATNFAAARTAMMSLKGDYGRPLGIRPDLLVVPPSLEADAEEILKADRNAAGATNTQKGKMELLVVDWLA